MKTIAKTAAWLPALVSVIALSACGEQQSGASAAPGCGSPSPISESTQYVPFEEQFSQNEPPPIKTAPVTPETANKLGRSEVAGEKLAGMAITNYGVQGYFFARDPSGLAVSQYFREGGLTYSVAPIAPGHLSAVDAGLERMPERFTLVEVGPFKGTVSWDDPFDATNLRPHRVIWTDGETNYELRGVAPAVKLLAEAQALVC